MEQPVLTLENVSGIISSRVQIPGDGVYRLKVTNVTFYDGRFIVNFNAMTQYHVEKAMELIEENQLRDAANQSLSANLRATDYIPSKGEVVKVVIEEVTTKKGVTGLFVTGVSEIQAASATKIDFAALLARKQAEASGEFTKLEDLVVEGAKK